jgi:Reverse transcriptase (RNA-dependent DNA polymerase)
VHSSEVIGPSDPIAALFGAAKQKKIQGLIERGTWKVVVQDEMPENPNIMGGRFVLTIKDSGTSKEIHKARYVVQSFRDKKKTSLVHEAPTSKQQSAKLLIGLAAIFGYRIFSTDVTQAYLQAQSRQ